MTRKECKCKVCGRAMEVLVDPDYNAVGDLSRLVPLATCNKCYDYVTQRNRLQRRLFLTCQNLLLVRRTVRPSKVHEYESQIREAFDSLTQSFAKMVAVYYDRNYLWSGEFVDFFMTRPDQCNDILRTYMKTYKAGVLNEQFA